MGLVSNQALRRQMIERRCRRLMVRAQKVRLASPAARRHDGGGSRGWVCGSVVTSWFVIGSGARAAVPG